MSRYYDIPNAFQKAIEREQTGRYTVTTKDFIAQLVKVNHHFSPTQANEWIDLYEPSWRLLEEGLHHFNKYYQFNPK